MKDLLLRQVFFISKINLRPSENFQTALSSNKANNKLTLY